MTFGQALALAQRNAIACENAREPVCRCHCGGKFHGKVHDAAATRRWAAEYAEQIEAFPEAVDA